MVHRNDILWCECDEFPGCIKSYAYIQVQHLLRSVFALSVFEVHADPTVDAVVGGGLGGAAGAEIGNEVGGKEGAIVGGAIVGTVGAAVRTDENPDHSHIPKKIHVEYVPYVGRTSA